MSQKGPDLEALREALRTNYPTLHAFRNQAGLVEIAGAFIVRGTVGEELDRFSISVVAKSEYPDDLPIVRETAGRIPWIADRHVEPDGKACVMLEEERWSGFPAGSSLLDFLSGPVANYFLSQSHFEAHGEWPFGEWAHYMEGVRECYREMIGTKDDLTVYRFLHVLAKQTAKPHYECPCGSGAKIRRCCARKIAELRSNIPWRLARKRIEAFNCSRPYRGSRLVGSR